MGPVGLGRLRELKEIISIWAVEFGLVGFILGPELLDSESRLALLWVLFVPVGLPTQ